MPTFTFDVKLFATASVRAADHRAALSLLREAADDLDLGLVLCLPEGEVCMSGASMDGEPDFVGDDTDTDTLTPTDTKE